jgi:hypothetical protein
VNPPLLIHEQQCGTLEIATQRLHELGRLLTVDDAVMASRSGFVVDLKSLRQTFTSLERLTPSHELAARSGAKLLA